MNAKQQLAYNLNNIICNYINSDNIHRFYKKITYYNTSIYKYVSKDLYDDYKYNIQVIYNDIINGDQDMTIINDLILTLRKILLKLLFFE
jgi:hypothetical protein